MEMERMEMERTVDRRFSRLDQLFGAFASGEWGEFLAGCAKDLVLNVRGTAGPATMVPRSQIPQWSESTRDLAGGLFRSSVCFILVDENVGLVVLQHELERDGVSCHYQTVNHCVLRDDLIATWFCYPMNMGDYAAAWGIRKAPEPQRV
jgi:hypothetical protein